jgi:hypothetical protein
MPNKPQSVTRRAKAYAASKSLIASDREAEAWAAGYRSAIRDVRRVLMNTLNDAEAVEAVLVEFAKDAERMK